MEIEKINIDNLISPDYNPRLIKDKDFEKLKNSIKEFGYIDPIIVNRVNNHIIGGNQRYEALKELDYETVDVVFVEEKDPNREKALNIALNQISGEWDIPKLGTILNDMKLEHFDIGLSGFDDIELQDININLNTEWGGIMMKLMKMNMTPLKKLNQESKLDIFGN